MDKPSKEWVFDQSYLSIGNIVVNLKVINDAAERTVKLGSDYGEKIVKGDNQKQALLQGVELHRKVHEKPTTYIHEAGSMGGTVSHMRP